MTNTDLEDFYHLLNFIRAEPETSRTELRLNLMLKALGDSGIQTIKFSEFTDQLPEIFFPSTDHSFFEDNFCYHWKDIEVLVNDINVVNFYRMYIKELKKLYDAKKSDQIIYLVNRLFKLPTNILDENNGTLSFKYLRKCLRSYWWRYDKTFAKQFILDNLKMSKSKLV